MKAKQGDFVQFWHWCSIIVLIQAVIWTVIEASISISSSSKQHTSSILNFSAWQQENHPLTYRANHSKLIVPRLNISHTATTVQTHTDGFNLLWLISSKYHRNHPTTSAQVYSNLEDHSKRLHKEELKLHSNLPRRILHYYRNSMILSNSTLQLKGVMAEDRIGFEMEFRIGNNSGSGYLITGRSLNNRELATQASYREAGQEQSGVGNSRMRKAGRSSVWFGLFSKVSSRQFSLCLEYSNLTSRAKRKFIVPISQYNFTLDQWHKLAVHIDFTTNSIQYWVNCSHAGTFQVQRNKKFNSTNIRIYRLLQHRRKTKTPLQVIFRSVVITRKGNYHLPKQCSSNTTSPFTLKCSGGRVFMDCGPSCVRTCETELTSLQACTATCLRGCHCRPGQVYHRGQCIFPVHCPCRIGVKHYAAEAQITINNEICTCAIGKWNCYAVASFTLTPRNETILAGGNVNLTCGVSGNPLPTIRWHLPSDVTHRITSWNGNRNSMLSLYDVLVKDASMYTCSATRLEDGWSMNASSHVTVISPPVVTLVRSTVTATFGIPVLSIDCTISGHPSPKVVWSKQGTNLRFFPVSRGILRLKITNINRSDAGKYKCIAQNRAGRSVRSVILLVKLPPTTTATFKKRPHDRCVKSGHTAVFPCQTIDHNKQTNVTWFKDGKLLIIDGKKVVQKRHKLVIRRVNRTDTGTYNCLVTQEKTVMQAKGRLMIKGRMLPWSPWSACSATCGRHSYTSKIRECTGIPPNTKTCHGELKVSRRCNSHACPGICSSYGNPHYTTFDGRQFNFQGDCSYILSQDVGGNDFKIIQLNVGCGSRLSCVRKVTVILATATTSAVVDMEADQTVYLNGMLQTVPYLSPNGGLSVTKIGLYMVLRVEEKLEVRWAIPHRLYVIVSGRYMGRTQGLCGNFNGIVDDDKLSPRGRLLETDLEFGLSWNVKDGNGNYSCSAVSTATRPCSLNAALAQRAKGSCLFLLHKDSFGDCHSVVSPNSFVTSCMLDICSSPKRDSNMYFCTALSAYASECLRHGVVLNWRTSEICPVTCSGGTVYSECGPVCINYCPSDIKGGSICNPNGGCVAGCFCPVGKVLHKDKCIQMSDCPCTFNERTFYRGEIHERNCQKCVCKRGGWQCIFNNMLCDYPAAVARGPQSQIVPIGSSVILCCGVDGIPAPIIEWFKNGQKLMFGRNDTSGMLRGENLEDINDTLLLRNVSMEDVASYTCKAVNIHGSHNSNPATLKLVDAATSCDPIPIPSYVHLPEGCYLRADGIAENVVNLGRCGDDPCYVSHSTGSAAKCSPARYCCQPSITKPVLIRCRHSSYHTSFLMTIVQRCSCLICVERATIVEGVVKAARTGRPVNHVKISYNGRTVGYTTSTGSFRIQFPNLSPDIRHVTITVTDVMFKKYATTIKNLLVLTGQSTIHTIFMSRCRERFRFNATRGLQYTFRPSQGYSNRMRLVIPPNSLICNRRKEPFEGIVLVGISLIDRKRMTHEKREDSLVPGSAIAISIDGEEQLLSPSVVLGVWLYNRFGQSLGLLPGKFATLSLTTNGIRKKLQSWSLDDLTGYWRESGDRLEVVPHYTNRGDKMFIATATIKRLDSAWAIGYHKTPCYLRARVLDSQNQTLPSVRVSFTASIIEATETMLNSKNLDSTGYKTKKITFSSYVEEVTSSKTFANGVCLPIGCHDTGVLQASRIGNELVLLEPENPPSALGQVQEYRAGSQNSSTITLQSNMLNTLDLDQVNTSNKFAYFRSKADCRDTSPSLQTYVFRDPIDAHDGSVLSRFRLNYRNRAILTFGISDQRNEILDQRSSSQPRYCHIKVQVRIHASFALQPNHNIHQSIIEATTFRNKTNGVVNSMTIVGWRHVMLRTYFIEQNNEEMETQNVCIEYVCGGSTLKNNEQLVLHLTIRHTAGSVSNTNVETLNRPRCNFTLVQPTTKMKNSLFSNSFDVLNESEYFNRGGYVYISKNKKVQHLRRKKHRSSSKEFSGRTLAESKQHCVSSPTIGKISAYFECL